MRKFLGVLLAAVVVVAVLAAFGWLFFFRDGSQIGVGVNSNEAVQESRELVDTVAESMSEVGGRIRDVSGENGEENVIVAEPKP
ncbi:MAG TPA: hypothetical protein VGN57_10095 [Pirellulaceae bacterium]|jgi:hypothetical protein|nr:hypothetical protein [Pirellulaceae bacterium]